MSGSFALNPTFLGQSCQFKQLLTFLEGKKKDYELLALQTCPYIHTNLPHIIGSPQGCSAVSGGTFFTWLIILGGFLFKNSFSECLSGDFTIST